MRSSIARFPLAALFVLIACGGSREPAASSPSTAASGGASAAPAASTSTASTSGAARASTATGTTVIIPSQGTTESPDAPDGGLRIRYNVVVGLGGLDMDTPITNVGATLKPLIFASRECYLSALQRDGSEGGRVAMVLKVGRSGDVVAAAAQESTLDAAATSCIVALGRGQKFDADPSRAAAVRLSFTLSFRRQR